MRIERTQNRYLHAVGDRKEKRRNHHDNYIIIYSSIVKNKRAVSGGALLHEKYEQNISKNKYINDTLVRITITLEKSLHVISLYAPDISKPEEMTEEFYEALQTEINQLPQHEKVVLFDLNARISNEVVEVKKSSVRK